MEKERGKGIESMMNYIYGPFLSICFWQFKGEISSSEVGCCGFRTKQFESCESVMVRCSHAIMRKHLKFVTELR